MTTRRLLGLNSIMKRTPSPPIGERQKKLLRQAAQSVEQTEGPGPSLPKGLSLPPGPSLPLGPSLQPSHRFSLSAGPSMVQHRLSTLVPSQPVGPCLTPSRSFPPGPKLSFGHSFIPGSISLPPGRQFGSSIPSDVLRPATSTMDFIRATDPGVVLTLTGQGASVLSDPPADLTDTISSQNADNSSAKDTLQSDNCAGHSSGNSSMEVQQPASTFVSLSADVPKIMPQMLTPPLATQGSLHIAADNLKGQVCLPLPFLDMQKGSSSSLAIFLHQDVASECEPGSELIASTFDDSMMLDVLQTITRDGEELWDFGFPSVLETSPAGLVDTSNPESLHEPIFQQQKKNSGPLYQDSTISVEDSLYSILLFCQTENLSGSGLERLLRLIDLHLPKPNNLVTTSHLFFKLLERTDHKFELTHYCSVCWKRRRHRLDVCDTCVDPTRKVNYFVSVPLESQIQKLYAREGFLCKLQYRYNRTKRVPSNYEDVYDGSIYREAMAGVLGNANNISLTWYTDGVSLYECSTFSLWPFMFVINELGPHEKFKTENIISGGFWGSHDHPHPNVFLQPTYQHLINVREGVEVCPFGSEEKIMVKVAVLFGAADAPAKAAFLNLKYHSGHYSCPKCTIEGEKSQRSGNKMVFPHEDLLCLRASLNYQEILELVATTRESYLGVKGATILSHIMECNMFRSVGIDPMHCVYLGFAKQLLNLLFSPEFKDKPFSLFKNLKLVNERLAKLRLPHFVQRNALPVDKLSFWKASLCRNFFFYIMLCILTDLMKSEYVRNLVDVVKGVALLNKDSVSEADIELARECLDRFSKNFEELYGVENMSYNVHCLRHLPNDVKDISPLWLSSCFKFEDLNGKLANLAAGTRHAGLQISRNMSLIADAYYKVHEMKPGPVKDYCETLTQKWKRLYITEKISDTMFVIGQCDKTPLFPQLLDEMLSALYSDMYNFVTFSRLYKDGMLYVASSYEIGSKVSYFVKYGNSSYGKLLCFLKVYDPTSCEPHVFAFVKRILTTQVSSDVDVHFLFKCIGYDEEAVLVPVTDLGKICFRLTVDDNVYLSEPLNAGEME